MAIPLRQSTGSQEIPLGYFLDSTNGDTEETTLTINNTDIKLWKMGATTLANKNSGGATHISNGIYYAVLDATDSNTLGGLIVFVHVSGALAVRVECVVHPSNVYDALYGADKLYVDVKELSGSAQSLADLKDFADNGFDTVNDRVYADITAISADSTAADNLEADYDGNGYTKVNSTIGTCTDNTDMVASAPTVGDIRTEMEGVGTKLTDVKDKTDNLPATPAADGEYDTEFTDIKGTGFAKDTHSLPQCLTGATPAEVNAQVVDVIRTDTSVEPVQGAPSQTPTLEAMIKYIYFRMINKTTTTSTTNTMFKADGSTEVMKSTIGDDGSTFTKAAYVTGT